jgi:hypothetical protein
MYLEVVAEVGGVEEGGRGSIQGVIGLWSIYTAPLQVQEAEREALLLVGRATIWRSDYWILSRISSN